MAAETKVLTPTQLATKLAGADSAERVAKAFIRPFLRKHYTRKPDQRGSAWNLTPDQVKAVTAAWKKRQS